MANAVRRRATALATLHPQVFTFNPDGATDLARSLRALCASERSAASSAMVSIAIYVELRPLIVSAKVAAFVGLAFCELLCNALTHAFPCAGTGHVGIHLWRVSSLPDACAFLLIADDGQGFRDEPPTASDSGIPLARYLVERCGGTLTREPGSGTVWRIMLPLAPQASLEREADRVTPEPPRPAHVRPRGAQILS